MDGDHDNRPWQRGACGADLHLVDQIHLDEDSLGVGWAKEQLAIQQGRGWSSFHEKYVCADCFGDDVIKKVIHEKASTYRCSYCGAKKKHKRIACDMDVVMEVIAEGIFTEWEHAVQGVGILDGELAGDVKDTWNLVHYELELGVEEDELLNDIVDSLGMTDWSRRDPYGMTEDEELLFDLQMFTEKIKYKNRYI